MDGTAPARVERQASFVIRLWLETSSGKARWRGHVRHIQGPSEAYFEDLARLVAFIEERTGVPVPLKPEAR